MSDPTAAPPPPVVTLTEHPVDCPDCAVPMRLREGEFGPFYGCPRWPGCKNTHGCHPDGRPLGKPAGAAVRAARTEVHVAFDALWKGCPRYDSLPKPRELAYRWLAHAMGLPPSAAHIGAFDSDQCALALSVLAVTPVDVWRAHLTEWSELPGEPPRGLA